MKARRFPVLFCVAISLIVGAPLSEARQRTASQNKNPGRIVATAAQFTAADPASRQETIRAILYREASPATDELVGILKSALSDGSASIRRQAGEIIEARAGSVRFTADASKRRFLAQEASALKPLAAQLERILVSDPDRTVRRQALMARGNLEFTDSTNTGTQMSRPFAELLSSAFESERDDSIRSEMMKAFALGDMDKELQQRMVLEGLTDSSSTVVRAALAGVKRGAADSAMPQTVGFLKSADKDIRMLAAQGLAHFGAAARPHLDALQRALEVETDGIVRKTIEGAIAVISRSKRDRPYEL